jgi:ribonuclease J
MSETIRMIPLGGMGNVTKNMYLYEYGDAILIVDCGLGFPDATMLGIDILIPDIQYLEDKKDKIVGMVLTHGHDDHIGGLPYILPQLGTQFPIYGSKLTVAFAQDRIREFDINVHFKTLPEDAIKLGPFTIDNIRMTHSVPDTRHLAITTPVGTIYHGTDFKFDLNPIDGVRPDFQKIAQIGSRGVIALLSDSLNSETEEFSKSESTLTNTFDRQMRGVKGKVIITVMSSNLHRIQQAVTVAHQYGRKVAFVGRSVEQNVKTAVQLGYIELPTNMINRKNINKLPSNEVCIIIAGSQGQIGSSLHRVAEGEHTQVQIKPEDKVIFASEPIPGNEQNVYATIDSISRTGADVAYSDVVDNVHVSGHSSAIEQKLLISLVKPKHVVPIGGTFHHMITYRNLARSMGFSDNAIHLMDNGQALHFSQTKVWLEDALSLKNVMVDGLGIGDVGKVVLRDRQRMADEGIVIIIVPVGQQTGQVNGEIEVISRGFVYVKESQALIDQIKEATYRRLQDDIDVVTNWQSLRKKIETTVEQLLYQSTQRQPLILTVVLEV